MVGVQSQSCKVGPFSHFHNIIFLIGYEEDRSMCTRESAEAPDCAQAIHRKTRAAEH